MKKLIVKGGYRPIDIKRPAIAFNYKTGLLIKLGEYEDILYFHRNVRFAFVIPGYADHADDIVWMELHTDKDFIDPDDYRNPEVLKALYTQSQLATVKH